MSVKKKTLSAAIVLAWGIAATPLTASAVVPDGNYVIQINTTPTYTTSYGGVGYKFGKDGAWNSSFTIGHLPDYSSGPMTDNGTLVHTSNGSPIGLSVAGDGFAGTIGITVHGSTFSVTSFQVDMIPYGGWWSETAEFAPVVCAMNGTIDQSTGAMTFTPTGRMAAFSYAVLLGRFNVDNYNVPGNKVWTTFTTGSITIPSVGTIQGTALTAIGDINGDGRTDFKAVIVSGGQFGTDWAGANSPYYEAWNINLVSAP